MLGVVGKNSGAWCDPKCVICATAGGAAGGPRLYSLQKVVECAYHNMDRIRLVWGKLWAVIAAQLVGASCHPNRFEWPPASAMTPQRGPTFRQHCTENHRGSSIIGQSIELHVACNGSSAFKNSGRHVAVDPSQPAVGLTY